MDFHSTFARVLPEPPHSQPFVGLLLPPLPPGPSEFVDRRLSTSTSTELSEVSLILLWCGDRRRVPDSYISEWGPPDITLCNPTGSIGRGTKDTRCKPIIQRQHSWRLRFVAEVQAEEILRMNTEINVEPFEGGKRQTLFQGA